MSIPNFISLQPNITHSDSIRKVEPMQVFVSQHALPLSLTTCCSYGGDLDFLSSD